MSFRVNFFPLPYILTLILATVFVVVFNETIYEYLSASFEVNGIIIVLFIFCTIWILGSLAYFSRSSKLLSQIVSRVGPSIDRKSSDSIDGGNKKSVLLQSSYSVSGTLFDSPVFSAALAKLDRKNKLEVSKSDADEIAQTIIDSALRVLSPSKFISSIFILCGLFGTFLGLLHTIDGVASALASLSKSTGTIDVSSFIALLTGPLKGMSTAFSASLFGLSAALLSNFGNHTAWQKVLLFSYKVRAYLMSNTGIFDEDPSRISVRDLLVSLEDSFDMLYRGITERLDGVSNNISTMASVVVKTHERQERMLRVILKDHELMEDFLERIFANQKGLVGIAEDITERLSVVLPEAMKKVFAPFLEDILDASDSNAEMISRAVALIQDGVDISDQSLNVTCEISKLLNQNGSTLSNISNEIVTINDKLILDRVASLIAEGNGIKGAIAQFVESGNSLLDEANNLSADANSLQVEASNIANNVLSEVVNNNNLLKDVSGKFIDSNIIATETRDIIQQHYDSSIFANELSKDILDSQRASNALLENGVVAFRDNALSVNDKLLSIGNMLEESNNLQVATIDNLSEVSQHNINTIRVLDERLGMIISLSSDMLSTSGETLNKLKFVSDFMVTYYEGLSLAKRLDVVGGATTHLAEMISSGLPLLKASVDNGVAIVDKLDRAEELNNNMSNEVLCGISSANETLNNLYLTSSQYFNDVANFSALYVGMEKQISALLRSFLEFKDSFAALLKDTSFNAQTLSSISTLNSGMVERIDVVGSLLKDVGVALTKLNGISEDNKNLSLSICNGLSGIIDQNNVLNSGVGSLGEIVNKGVGSIVEGINVINNTSSEYAIAVNQLLENIISKLTYLSEITSKVSDIEKTSVQSSGDLKVVVSHLEQQSHDNKTNVALNNEIKDILVNADTNIMQIGNILSNVEATNNDTVNRLDSIVKISDKSVEYAQNSVDSGIKVQKSLDQVIELINTLGSVYENYGGQTKKGLNDIVEGISSVLEVNNGISGILGKINQLTESIQKDSYGKSNNEVLASVSEKLVYLISLKEKMLAEVDGVIKPSLGNLGDNLSISVSFLESLSSIASSSQASIAKLGSETGKVVADKIEVVNKSISNLSGEFKLLSGYVSSIDKMFGEQKNVVKNIDDALKSLTAVTKDFSSIPKILTDSANAISIMSKAVSSLESSSNNINKNTVEVLNDLSEEIKSVAKVLLRLDDGVQGSLGAITQNNKELYGNINVLLGQISTLGNDLRKSNDIYKVGNSDALSELSKNLNAITSSLADLKEVIVNNVGSQLKNELNKIGNNQNDMAAKFEKIAPYINELISLVSNISNQGSNNDLFKIVNVLEKISDHNISNDSKLDLLVRATDTLVAEMLNSRNVSQAILDIIAELGGFKKVN